MEEKNRQQKRGRHLIRAILFIVRLRRDVQSAHRRRTTRRRMGALAKTAAMLGQNSGGGGCSPNKMKDRPPLSRCESSRRPRHELLRQSQHRNSAPSTIYPAPISPSPQPLNNFEEGEVDESNSEFGRNFLILF
uniref:Candidate secreted effector n=1 Tax=Meloidogyne incognita TaxID=6306 RepID=A0A914ML68_MELIC